MNYTKLWIFEIRQFVRILWETYVDVKYNHNLLEKWFDTLKLEDKKVLIRYKNFKNFLEKELKMIYKEIWKENLEDFLYLFPKIQRYRRPKNIKIKISKKHKNI